MGAEPGYGYYGRGYGGYGYGRVYGGYRYGKREAEASADAEPGYGYYGRGYGGYGYGRVYGGYGRYYGKRSAEADAEPGYGYYGRGYVMVATDTDVSMVDMADTMDKSKSNGINLHSFTATFILVLKLSLVLPQNFLK